MFCSKCGRDNIDTVKFCGVCGNQLSAPAPIVQESADTLSQSGPELEKTSVILLIILMLITLGIYYPIWFLKRINAINNLQSEEKLGPGVFIFAIVGIIAVLLLGLISGSMEKAGEIDTARGLNTFCSMLNLGVAIALLVQCFKVRRILNEHFNAHLQRGIEFSWVAIFFFHIFYLQYKINRF
ncbi:MAG: zinc ribbon domain-containing protein [Candidatus Brocadiales bacterium]